MKNLWTKFKNWLIGNNLIVIKCNLCFCEGKAGGTHWTGERNKGQNIPHEMKQRWVKTL